MPIIIISICIILLLAGCAVSVICSYTCLEATKFQTTSERIIDPVRLVILGDLHNHEFGRDNQKLIEKVAKQEPGLILMVGDILDAEGEDDFVALNLVEQLSRLAPVYYALGNHEVEFQMEHTDFITHLEEAGGTVLEMGYRDVEIGSTQLRIGGMYGYAFQTEEETVGVGDRDGYQFLKEFTDTDKFKIMMFHRPESFVLGNAAQVWKMDMVVSAHIHGGQVILPFAGGIYGAELGWFPEYTHGRYKVRNTELYLTRGLGSGGESLPRFNNLPEIMVVDLM